MSLVRLWLFTPRVADPPYPEGGTYDTSVLNTDTGNCSDPHQEVRFADLMQYASLRGEVLQKVGTAEEAFALCSAQRVIGPPVSASTNPTSVSVSGCPAGMCGPTLSQTVASAAPPSSGSSGGGNPSPGSLGLPGANPSPGSLGLPGTSGLSTAAPPPTTLPSPTTLQPVTGFDLVAFLKGPMGILLLALLGVAYLFSRSERR